MPAHQHQTGVGPACRTQKETTMLKKLAAVLIATSMIAAPALAQGTAPAASGTPAATAKAPDAKSTAKKSTKVKKQAKAKHAKAQKSMKDARKSGDRAKQTVSKPAPQTTGSAPKAGN
jgi:hypothetical protein